MINFSTLDVSLLVLVVLLTCGVLSQNNTIIISSAILIVLKVIPFTQNYLPLLEKYGLNLGILLLTIAVLSPIASGKISTQDLLKSFASWQAVLAILVGVFVAWLGGRGVKLMSNEPTVVSGLLIGTVIGVFALRGVPVGPLIAAGILSLFYGASK